MSGVDPVTGTATKTTATILIRPIPNTDPNTGGPGPEFLFTSTPFTDPVTTMPTFAITTTIAVPPGPVGGGGGGPIVGGPGVGPGGEVVVEPGPVNGGQGGNGGSGSGPIPAPIPGPGTGPVDPQIPAGGGTNYGGSKIYGGSYISSTWGPWNDWTFCSVSLVHRIGQLKLLMEYEMHLGHLWWSRPTNEVTSMRRNG